MFATNQGILNAAQASMSLQTGRPLSTPASGIPPQMSAEARDRRDLLSNMFPDMPRNLPAWELMATMSVPDNMAFITAKMEQVKDVGGGSDIESFQKATSPVLYSSEQWDGRLTKLHSASFLRAPLSEPVVYWHLLEKKREHVSTIILYSNKLQTIFNILCSRRSLPSYQRELSVSTPGSLNWRFGR